MILLASRSPRRAELLHQLGIQFSQFAADIDEQPHDHESPAEYVTRMAREKARQGVLVATEQGLSGPVLGADTSVIVDEHILGKPADEQQGKAMLRLLSGRSHQVLTAVALALGNNVEHRLVGSTVTFARLTEQQIQWYWQTEEPRDKAGAYAIQGKGAQFVCHLDGSYSAVMGLPLYETMVLLNSAGVDPYEC